MKYAVFTNTIEGISKMRNSINFLVASIALFTLVSCGSNEPKVIEESILDLDPKVILLHQIDSLETEMHKSEEINNTIAAKALQAYFQYSKKYPSDSVTPDFVFKSAEILTALQQYPQAYSNYKTIAEKYPTYKLVQESLFLEASILDHYLNEDDKAKIVYEDLIKRYPESSYAKDAKSSIENLGKSDEDLIKEFKKKNGEK